MTNTKEEILQSALRLFAKDGYEAVSVSVIASEVGITKGALYRHYKNKRDIFEHIVTRMEEMDANRIKTYEMPVGPMAQKAETFRKMPIEKIKEYSEAMLVNWTEDEFAANFRKVLTLEQYRNPEMSMLYQRYFVTGAISYITRIFALMLDISDLDEANELAMRFYAPIYLLYSVYDGADEEKRAKLKETLRRHVETFEKEVGKRRKEL